MILFLILIWNLIVFSMYGIDKYKSAKGKWRISEKSLILSALCLGGAGAMLGMKCFRHKTKHFKFNIVVPVSFIITAAAVTALIYYIR